jgi:hypothetical protein
MIFLLKELGYKEEEMTLTHLVSLEPAWTSQSLKNNMKFIWAVLGFLQESKRYLSQPSVKKDQTETSTENFGAVCGHCGLSVTITVTEPQLCAVQNPEFLERRPWLASLGTIMSAVYREAWPAGCHYQMPFWDLELSDCSDYHFIIFASWSDGLIFTNQMHEHLMGWQSWLELWQHCPQVTLPGVPNWCQVM